jgi:chemotaxis protein CheC
MILTEQQQDGLAELINIAFSRTAASLSDLTSQRVLLDVPRVTIYPIEELATALTEAVPGEIATVHQVFSGPMEGDALLLFSYDGAVQLSELLTNDSVHASHLDASAREVLIEVGNILLNACLGVFGNVFQFHLSFSVPRLHLDALRSVIASLSSDQDEMRYALIAYTSFRLRDSAISGFLVLVLGLQSLELLIQEIEKLG